MESTTPQSLSVVILPDGLSIDLPPRNLGAMRYAGLFPMAFGLAFSGFAVFWTCMASRGMIDSNGQFHWFPALFALWGVPFILVGLAPIGIGLAMIAGRTRIQWSNNRLQSIELVGPFRWTRSRPIKDLQTLMVLRNVKLHTSNYESTSSRTLLTMQNLAALQAHYASTKPFMLAMGYPAPLLEQVAHELSKSILAKGNIMVQTPRTVLVGHDDRINTATNPPIPVVVEQADDSMDAAHRQPYPQPASTRCTLVHNPEGITLTVPPAGLFKGSHGLFTFALIWNGFMVVFTSLAGGSLLSGQGFTNENGQPVSMWIPLLFISVFWAVGIGMMIGAIHMAKRKVIFDVIAPGTDAAILLVTQQSLRGTKQQEWPRAEISAILVGPSGMKVNDKPVMQVQIHLTNKQKKIGYLTGRPEPELHWIAWELHQALGLS